MVPQVLEGTWEEVAQYAPQLSGRRVKVIIIPDDVPATDSLAANLAELVQLADDLDPERRGMENRGHSALEPVLVEKYRRQGFHL